MKFLYSVLFSGLIGYGLLCSSTPNAVAKISTISETMASNPFVVTDSNLNMDSLKSELNSSIFEQTKQSSEIKKKGKKGKKKGKKGKKKGKKGKKQ